MFDKLWLKRRRQTNKPHGECAHNARNPPKTAERTQNAPTNGSFSHRGSRGTPVTQQQLAAFGGLLPRTRTSRATWPNVRGCRRCWPEPPTWAVAFGRRNVPRVCANARLHSRALLQRWNSVRNCASKPSGLQIASESAALFSLIA